jgi:sterol desaturase/sphingolipid hydroxylase (fatty acid hydroxylase superfamily)
MSETISSSTHGYQPERIDLPPLFAWPPRPLAAFKWLTMDLLFPWGMLWIAIAIVAWYFLTPDLSRMHSLELDWIMLIWFRNAALLTLVAGGLHWWYYIRKGQKLDTKFNNRWPATDDDKFLWKDQVKDNMFWSIVSGVSFWTAYESMTYWWYANGHFVWPTISDSPVYFIAMIWAVFFWNTFHFYFNHRALHWKPLYNFAHELHHRNANTGPWTGISMHPVEHLIYFSVFLLWWIVPVHPIIIVLTGLFQGISPAVSHSGFDYLTLGRSIRITTGDNFHNLHHRFFHTNYGNSMTPLDWVFDSWHDGSEKGKAILKRRLRGRTA